MESGMHSNGQERAGIRRVADVAKEELANIKADLNDLVYRVSHLSRSDLESARDKFKESLGGSQEKAKGAAKEYASAAKEYASSAKDTARDYAGSARQHLGDGVDRSCAKIRERPLESLAIAVGVGLVLGSLLSRRD